MATRDVFSGNFVLNSRKKAKKSSTTTIVSSEETASDKRKGNIIVSVVENRAREVCVAKMDTSNVIVLIIDCAI